MSLVEKLLAFLPPEIKVANCCFCGSLCTRNTASARAFAKYGLKLWTGLHRDPRTNHVRPICSRCHLYAPRELPPPLAHRTEGQRNRLKKFFDEEEHRALPGH